MDTNKPAGNDETSERGNKERRMGWISQRMQDECWNGQRRE